MEVGKNDRMKELRNEKDSRILKLGPGDSKQKKNNEEKQRKI